MFGVAGIVGGDYRRPAVEKLLREHHRGDRDHSTGAWQLLVFELSRSNYLARPGKTAGVMVGAMQV
jgi:hypothetical protein